MSASISTPELLAQLPRRALRASDSPGSDDATRAGPTRPGRPACPACRCPSRTRPSRTSAPITTLTMPTSSTAVRHPERGPGVGAGGAMLDITSAVTVTRVAHQDHRATPGSAPAAPEHLGARESPAPVAAAAHDGLARRAATSRGHVLVHRVARSRRRSRGRRPTGAGEPVVVARTTAGSRAPSTSWLSTATGRSPRSRSASCD